MGIANYFKHNVRKRVPSRLQRKKRSNPAEKGVSYQKPDRQISLDHAISNETHRKEMVRERRKQRVYRTAHKIFGSKRRKR